MKLTAYVALGANIGNREENLVAAVRLLCESGCDVAGVSSLYATKPVGVTDQPDFLNAVVAVKTDLNPHDLLATCRRIEHELGRQRTIRWGPRVIDIDILLYEGAAVDEKELIIPHPRMLERAFVLVPLAEVAPDVDVGGGLTACEALTRIDLSGVERVCEASWSD